LSAGARAEENHIIATNDGIRRNDGTVRNEIGEVTASIGNRGV
jgi:hypothetical protein